MTKHESSSPSPISADQLSTISGGVTGAWLANHPYAAAGFLAHHPVREAQFANNHPCAFSRIQAIQNRWGS
jgi:hypothetical protein